MAKLEPTDFVLEMRSDDAGWQWTSWERGEHPAADFALSRREHMRRMENGGELHIQWSNGQRYRCRLTPRAWLDRAGSHVEGSPK